MPPRDVRGHTWPNDGREWNIEDLLRGSGQTGAVTFIHFQVLKDPWVHSAPSQDNRAIIGKLLYGWPPQSIPPMPDLLIHIRFYMEFFEDVPPLEWASRVAHMLQNWTGSAWIDGGERQISLDLSTLPNIAVSVYNELNLSYEHRGLTQDECQSPEAYQRFAEAELVVFQELDRLLPHRQCLWVSSAPALGHDAYPDDPDSEWAIIQGTGLLDYVDLVGAHFYTEKNLYKPIDYKPESGPYGLEAFWYSRRGERPVGYREEVQGKKGRPHDRGGVFRQLPQYRYFITEWGTFACEVKDRTDETIRDSEGMLRAFADVGNVVAATNFIWLAGDMHKPNVVWYNEPYRNWLANLPPYYTAAELPTARWRWSLPAPEPEEPPMPDEPKPKYPVYKPGALWQAIANPDNGLTQVSKEFSEWEDGGVAYIYVKKASDGLIYKLFLFNDPDHQGLRLEGPIVPFQ